MVIVIMTASLAVLWHRDRVIAANEFGLYIVLGAYAASSAVIVTVAVNAVVRWWNAGQARRNSELDRFRALAPMVKKVQNLHAGLGLAGKGGSGEDRVLAKAIQRDVENLVSRLELLGVSGDRLRDAGPKGELSESQLCALAELSGAMDYGNLESARGLMKRRGGAGG